MIVDLEMASKIMAKEEQLLEPQSLIMSLPKDIIVDILARVSRFDYPILSLVSKHFRSLVTSNEIYVRRSLLGCTEHCLYVVLSDKNFGNCRWYILRWKANGNRGLVLIPSLPVMPGCSCFVLVGSRIYVFGGIEDHTNKPSGAFSIDCTSHTVQPLPSMPATLIDTIAHVIDGKIYVFGYCYNDKKKVIVVFNTETQMWEPGMIQPNIVIANKWYGGSVVMGDKIITRNNDSNSYIYEPKENTWETDEILNSKWWCYACAIDDILYYYNCEDFDEKELRAYDPKQSCWKVVKGLEKLLPKMKSSWWSVTYWSRAVSYGGNLALFFHKEKRIRRTIEIRCAEVSLETRQDGEIWGQVQWCNLLVTGKFKFVESLDVVV